MKTYIIRRLLLYVPVLFLVSAITFIIMRIAPGDVALLIMGGTGEERQVVKEQDLAALRKQLGLDKSLPAQYVNWIWGILRFDLGKSLWTGRDIAVELRERLPLTAELALLAILMSLVIAIPVGVLSAIRQDTWVDYVFRVVSIGGLALPSFWVATMVILFLVLFFNWIPPLGYAPAWEDPVKNLKQLVWPVLVLGYGLAAVTSRMTRSTMLEVLRQDYIRTAWAKGLGGRAVVVRHALKNAFLPVLTISALQLGHLLGGAVVAEQIFVLPGVGATLVQAIGRRDYPVVEDIILMMAVVFLTMNLLTDLLYGWLDPRIRYQ